MAYSTNPNSIAAFRRETAKTPYRTIRRRCGCGAVITAVQVKRNAGRCDKCARPA